MPTPNLFVGIDVAKSKLDVCFLDANESPVHPGAIYPNAPRGWSQLLDALDALHSSDGYVPWCTMESTGVYHEAFSRYLSAQERVPMVVDVLNPSRVKHLAKAMLLDAKTDKLDRRVIAQYTIRMKLVHTPLPTDERQALKEITRSRRRFVGDHTKEVNRLHSLLHRHYPGYQDILGQTLTLSLLAILSDIQSPEEILERSVDQLAAIRIGARHRVRRSIATRVRELASQAPVQKLGPAVELLIRMRARRIREIDAQLAELDACIAEQVDAIPQGRLLMSIPGLGPVTAAVILAEVGDIRQFASKEAFVGYCGLYPIVWESGDAKRKYRMTRKGNSWLKTALLVVTGPARLHNPTIAEYSQRLKDRGKTSKAAAGALARKLAHIVWAIMTSGQPWSNERARQGQEKGTAMRRNRTS